MKHSRQMSIIYTWLHHVSQQQNGVLLYRFKEAVTT